MQLSVLRYILLLALLFGNLYITQAHSTGSSSDSIAFVKDAKGNLYTINTSTGQATYLGRSSGAQADPHHQPFDTKRVNADRAVAVFDTAAESRYGFDVYDRRYASSSLFSEAYEELKTGGEPYRVPFKLIPEGAADAVRVTLRTAPENPRFPEMKIDIAKVVFRTAAGTEYRISGEWKEEEGRWTAELMLPSAKANDGYELYALHPVWAPNSDGYEYDMLGKLTVVSYPVKTPKVTLVSVNGNTVNKNAVKEYLDRVYLPVGVHWQVSETAFDYDMPKDSFDVTGSGMFSRYTPAMKRMNAAFMQRSDYDPETLYIFVLQRASMNTTSGDMPRGMQFGYLFTGTIADAVRTGKDEIIGRTVAHELGHGMFRLKHTFDSEYRIAQESTENLMDYSWGTDMVKHQWDAIHAPGLVIGAFERDEDGMMGANSLYLSEEAISQLIEQIRQGNKAKKTVQAVKLITKTGAYDKITLGKKNYSYIKMETTGFNTLLDRKPTMTIQTNNGPVTLPAEMPSYDIAPSELSRSVFSENNTRYVKYQFHELQENTSRLNIKESTETVRIGITVKESESESFEEYLYPMEDIFLENVTWVSQFDESIFGLCTGCWKVREVNGRTYVSNSCCRRATEYMMGNTNIANCTDSIIAQSAPYMSVRGRINTATFSDNTSRYTSDTYNAAILNYQSETITDAVRYVKNELKNGRPVLIGVHYISNGRFSPPNNTNRATRHFMVVVGMGLEGEREYFRFYDPGRKLPEQTDATSPNNKLYIDHQQGFIQGIYDDRTYTITEIIKHN